MSEEKCVMNNAAKKINQFIFCNDNICKIKKIPPELESAIGKIKNVIPTGLFKDDLLLRMKQVRRFLKRGFITEALVVLSTVIEKVDHKINQKKTPQTGLNLVIGDLLRLKQAILDRLNHCVVDDHFDKLVTIFQEFIEKSE